MVEKNNLPCIIIGLYKKRKCEKR